MCEIFGFFVVACLGMILSQSSIPITIRSLDYLAVYEHEIFFNLQFAYFILSIFEDTLYNIFLNQIDKFENRFVG